MKLNTITLAYNVLQSLSASLPDPKLAIKVNRIIREIKGEAESFLESAKKGAELYNEEYEKIGLEHGAKKVIEGNGFRMVHEDKEQQEIIDALSSEKMKEVNNSIVELGNEDRPFELKSTKLTFDEIENSKFRTEHKFDFSSLNSIPDFIE